LIAQPVNSASSLAFVLCGLAIVWVGTPRREDGQEGMQPIAAAAFGVVVIAAGLGSLVFHASITEWGGWADLVGAAAVLVFVVVYRLAPKASPHRFLTANAIGVGAVAALLWIVGTGSGKYVLYALAFLAVAAELSALRQGTVTIRRDWRWIWVALLLFAVGAVIWWSARTGHSLCTADSAWQWHALWHGLVAAALGALFMHWRSEVSVGQRSVGEGIGT
jgi:hypothetical protein